MSINYTTAIIYIKPSIVEDLLKAASAGLIGAGLFLLGGSPDIAASFALGGLYVALVGHVWPRT